MKKILLTATTITVALVALAGIFIVSASTGFTSSENLVEGKEGCINRVLNLATLGEIKSVSTYDTAIHSCG